MVVLGQVNIENSSLPVAVRVSKTRVLKLPISEIFARGDINYKLTHSASELSGFTCTSSLTMNEKIQYRTRPPSAVLKISNSLLVNECR